MIDFETGAPVAADLGVRWIHGARGEPAVQVHACDPHTFLLRQSKATSYEAPFIYLLFGNARAMLLDTGATADPAAFPLRETVDGLIGGWLAENPRERYELVVAHTHGHGDHVAGDPQFAGRAATTVVPPRLDYPLGSRYQPDEPPLEMTVAQLLAVRDAARSVAARPGAHAFDDFIIFNGPCRGAVARQLARAAWRRMTRQDAAR